MKRSLSLDVTIHYTMALVGGFLGGYAVLGRCNVLGSAQTGNLINLVLDLLGHDLIQVLFRIGSMLLYAGAIALTVLLPKYTRLNLKPVSIALDCVAVVLLGFLPADMDSVVALYPVFFAMAFQWNAFPGALGYASSCIFSTNNLRQTTMALTEYFCTRQREPARKALFFGGSLLFYHLGVAAAFLTVHFWQLRASWFCLIPLSAAAVQYKWTQRTLHGHRPVKPGVAV